MTNFNNLTIGTDPEFFASYIENGKEYVEPPVIFRNLGAKFNIPKERLQFPVYQQHPEFIVENDIVIMEDGAAFEYTLPPTNNPKVLFSSIQRANDLLEGFISQYGEYRFYNKPVINFDIERFNIESLSEDVWSCMIFGCDKDNDAIETEYVSETLDVSDHPFRYAGGHLHFGSKEESEKQLIKFYWLPFVRLLAITVGNICISQSNFPDLEKQRAFHYGKPGRYRVQPHGIEYRTPSNSWTSSLETTKRIFEGGRFAFHLLNNEKEGMKVLDNYLEPTIKAITTADRELSNSILNKLSL